MVSTRGSLDCVSGKGRLTARAIIFPPHVEHSLFAEEGFLSVFFDPLRFAVPSIAHALPEAVSVGRGLKRSLEGIESIAEQALRFESGEGALQAEVKQLVHALNLPVSGRLNRAVVDTQLVLHHTEDPSVDLAELSRKVGLSPSRLRHLFAREVGVPLRRYRLWCRLMRTLNGATTTRSTFRAVCAESPSQPRAIRALGRLAAEQGFADQSHMTRVFLRLLGRTPGSLRGQLVSLSRYY